MRKALFALIFAAAALAQPTPDQAARLESQLKQSPDDANARSQLIRLYFRDPQKTPVRVQHILWFVAHQPDAAVLDEPSATVNGPGESYDYLKRAWLSKIDEPRATASTLSKAANFFRPTDPDRSIALLKKARSMEPQNWMWVAQLAQMYAFRLTGITGLNQNGLPNAVDPAIAQSKEVADLTAELLASRDTELLGMVAAALGGQGAIAAAMTGRGDETSSLSERLIERSKEIDPHNSKWDFMIGQLYANRAEHAAGEQRAQLARRAFQHFEAARKIDPSVASAARPSQYARVAIEVGDLKAARDAGDRCLAQVPSLNVKDAGVHECNLILGRVALRQGDTASAVRYLYAAANVSGGGSLPVWAAHQGSADEAVDSPVAGFTKCFSRKLIQDPKVAIQSTWRYFGVASVAFR